LPDVGHVLEPERTSEGGPTKDQDDNGRAMVIPGNKELDLIPKVPRVEASSDRDVEVAELTVDPRNSERVSRGEI
jgi:hypothetical protein